MREAPRFDTDIPINIVGENVESELNRQLCNVSYGGVACHSKHRFKPGEHVFVRIPSITPPFEVDGIVVWCDQIDEGNYEVGIQFHEGEQAFSVRMVEQICRIEHYKQKIQELEGRTLTGDEAAFEWIQKNGHKKNVQGRAFIRHPSNVPIEITYAQQVTSRCGQLRNFSFKGVCVTSSSAIPLGERVQIQLPKVDDTPSKKLVGIVMWCEQLGEIYEVGIKFIEENEQVLIAVLKKINRIEEFKAAIKRSEGRELTGEETVAEYTAFFAKSKNREIDRP